MLVRSNYLLPGLGEMNPGEVNEALPSHRFQLRPEKLISSFKTISLLHKSQGNSLRCPILLSNCEK